MPDSESGLVVVEPTYALVRGDDERARNLDVQNKLETVRRILARPDSTTELRGSDKQYLYVDTWREVAAHFGVFAHTVGAGDWIDDPLTNALAFRCRVEARYGDLVVGAATGVCSAGETLKRKGGGTYRRWEQMFEVEGMAQTRATSRALRNAVGFLISMVDGYSVETPEEARAAASSEPRSAQPERSRNQNPQRSASNQTPRQKGSAQRGAAAGGKLPDQATIDAWSESARAALASGNPEAFVKMNESAVRRGLEWVEQPDGSGAFEPRDGAS